jgi:hypothetical protein
MKNPLCLSCSRAWARAKFAFVFSGRASLGRLRLQQQEIKRRTRKVRVFPNHDALLRLATAILVEIDEDWATSERIYINWDKPDA